MTLQDSRYTRVPRRALLVAMLAALPLAALAQSLTLQVQSSGRLVQALPGGPAQASGQQTNALSEYQRLYLGNGWFVLQNRFSKLCLSVQDNGLVTEAAWRDGAIDQQFQVVGDESAGAVSLRARANGRLLVAQGGHGALRASATEPSADSAFVLRPTRHNEAIGAQIDSLHTRQTVVGFGGALVFNETRLVANPFNPEIYRALFDPVEGLGITMLRLGNNFDISTTDAPGYAEHNLALAQGASAALGRPVTLMLSAWGPPAYLKSNNSTTGGTLIKRNGQYDYAGYAKWWADSVSYWRSQGLDPTYVSIQNEPEVVVDYISNHFNPHEDVPYGDGTYGAPAAASYGKALNAVYQSFQGLPQPPRLLGPEVDGPALHKVQDYLAEANINQLYGLAHHLYDTADPTNPDSFIPDLQGVTQDYPDKLKFQTEWFSDGSPMVEAEAIHDVLVAEGANAYIKWSLANSGTTASAIYDDDGTQPQSTWKYPHGWNYNDNYYVMKHYAYFIRPGFQRVDAYVNQKDLKVSAYLGKAAPLSLKRPATVVVLNTSTTQSIPLTIGAPVLLVSNTRVFRTSYSSSERWQELAPWHDGAPIQLPPQSIVTIAFNPQ